MEKNRGVRLGGCTMQPPDDTPKLSDLGIEKIQSHRWQAIGRIPEEEFKSEMPLQ